MPRRTGMTSWTTLATVCLTLAVAPSARADSRVIGPGVSAGGVDLSNLTVDAAAGRLSTVLGPRLSAPLVIGVAGRTFRLAPATVGLHFDPVATAQGAYQAGASRPAPAPGAGPAPVEAPVVVSQSEPEVRAFVRGISKRVDRAPRDASVHITLRHVYRRPSRLGHHVAPPALVKAINQALDSPSAPRVIHMAVVKDRPKITTAALPRHYRAIVTVDRAHFRLRLFVHLRFAHSYPVAVGQVGWPPRPACTTCRTSRSTPRGTCPTPRGRARWPDRRSRPGPPTTR